MSEQQLCMICLEEVLAASAHQIRCSNPRCVGRLHLQCAVHLCSVSCPSCCAPIADPLVHDIITYQQQLRAEQRQLEDQLQLYRMELIRARQLLQRAKLLLRTGMMLTSTAYAPTLWTTLIQNLQTLLAPNEWSDDDEEEDESQTEPDNNNSSIEFFF